MIDYINSKAGTGVTINALKVLAVVGLVACPNQVQCVITEVSVEPVDVCTVMITVTGYGPDLCWEASQSSLVVESGESDTTLVRVHIEAQDAWESGPGCYLMIAPYDFQWYVPVTAAGHYRVEAVENRSSLRNPGADTTCVYFNLPYSNCPLCGDIDISGELTVDDLYLLRDYYFGFNSIPSDQAGISDLNCDGYITLADLVLLVGYVYGYGPDPCCVPPIKRPELPRQEAGGPPGL